jgi:hypothetical protein
MRERQRGGTVVCAEREGEVDMMRNVQIVTMRLHLGALSREAALSR